MIRKTRLAAVFAFAAGLAAAGAASAQTETGGAAAPAASTQPTTPWAPSATLKIKPWDPDTSKPWDPDASQPTYSVNPPADGPSGIYLPAVILGYAKSAAGCVVIGCDDGPQVDGSSGPPSSRSAAPPVNPWLSDPR